MDVDDEYDILGDTLTCVGEHTIQSPFRRSTAALGLESQVSIPKTVKSEVSVPNTAKRSTLSTAPGQMFRTPLQTVTVRAQGEEFHVHKELLVKDSFYFDKALNGGFIEAETQEIDLDDVTPADFGFYVDILYRSFFVQKFVLRKEQTGGSLSTRQLLAFWQLADRFLNNPLREMAAESLHHRLSLYSPTQWAKIYAKRPKEDIVDRVRRLQDAYNQCLEGGMPFGGAIVQAAANCPGEAYEDSVHIMEADFMAMVSKKVIATLTKDLAKAKEEKRLAEV